MLFYENGKRKEGQAEPGGVFPYRNMDGRQSTPQGGRGPCAVYSDVSGAALDSEAAHADPKSELAMKIREVSRKD